LPAQSDDETREYSCAHARIVARILRVSEILGFQVCNRRRTEGAEKGNLVVKTSPGSSVARPVLTRRPERA
jgi:hypothetical protein